MCIRDRFYRDHAHLTRTIFNLAATPAALLAIGSGTALFLRESIFDAWLIVKLTTVAGMVLCHALCGVLILRIERVTDPSLRRDCLLIGLLLAGLISACLLYTSTALVRCRCRARSRACLRPR